jgi:peroxiredoxin
MAKSFSFSGIFSNPIKKNDVFLLGLLIASLVLNVYLGWNLKRLKSTSAEPQDSVKLSPGMTVQPITATSLSGKQETISYADYGKPTVFYVFSPTCIWCDRNNQNINEIVRLKGESFRFIGLSLADDALQGYVESHHLSFPVYKSLTPESIQILGLGPTPQTIVISPDGHVLKNWVGAYGTSVQPQVEEFFNVRLPGLTAQQK